MNSPFNKKPMALKHEEVEFKFRKEPFKIWHHFYECTQTKERFTDEHLDTINTNQVYNQYREKYGIPFPEEIIAIREKYGVSAARMSEILGLGANTYRLYEAEEMPSVANGRLIGSIDSPDAFINQVEASSHFLSEKEQEKLISIANKIKEKVLTNLWDHLFEEKIFRDHKPSEFNGYKIPDLEKISQVIGFFSSRTDLFKTKLNKLLFYTDFLMYKTTACSMTGITYRAIPFGPVPAEYDKMYIKLGDDQKIQLSIKYFSDGNCGEQIKSNWNKESSFNKQELEVLSTVADLLCDKNTKEIVEISHLEPAWQENEAEKLPISYQRYAFDLKAI